MFQKILIANRGEIAIRVIRACRLLGIGSVAIYSEADRDALHVRLADEAFCCGPARASESYLDVKGIVEIACRAGVDAVHPGYGFLSENAGFSEAVSAAGLVFIGPTPDVIASMGLKVASRERMIAAGVPVVPGGDEIEDVDEALRVASEIGYPVFVKASAGGGGRGMRLVEAAEDLGPAIERARSEAEAAFGDGTVYLEKFVEGPRHIEIQILADAAGKVLHLGERECSIQRRHQKLVEEAPAFGVDEALRQAMGESAVRAAQAVDYIGAGTCEFLLDAHGDFYFLEMNTRIQVEHPVTEAVTGVDLVDWQIRVAAGQSLPFSQSDIRLGGHAIEARIYAEDPDKGFIPSPGVIEAWTAPSGPGIRLDSGFEGGQTVSSHYDPMIAKLIVHGADRDEALARLAGALDEFWIAGIRTGLPFLRRLVKNEVFAAGRYDTAFIEREMPDGPGELTEDERDRVFALAALYATRDGSGGEETSAAGRVFDVALPKQTAVEVEVVDAGDPARVRVGKSERLLDVSRTGTGVVSLIEGGVVQQLTLVPRKKGGFDVGLADRVLRLKISPRN